MSLSAVVTGGLAVVLFTMAVRAALLPLSIRAARATHDPFAALWPALLQFPFLIMLYSLFNSATVDGQPNGLLDSSVLGVHLGTRFFTDPGALVFWLVFVALIAIAWYASRRLRGVIRILPFFTVLVAGYVPLAAGLYLITSTAWTAVERTVLSI